MRAIAVDIEWIDSCRGVSCAVSVKVDDVYAHADDVVDSASGGFRGVFEIAESDVALAAEIRATNWPALLIFGALARYVDH